MRGCLVSVITPFRDGERYFHTYLHSLRSQPDVPLQPILVDDGSRNKVFVDRFFSGISSLFPNAVLLSNGESIGAGPSRNRALEHAAGSHLAFLDIDDLWLSGKLSYQLKAMEYVGAPMCCTSYLPFSDITRRTYRVINCPRALTTRAMRLRNHVGLLTAVVRADCSGAARFGSTRSHEDAQYFGDIIRQHGAGVGLGRVTSMYRLSSNSLTSQKTGASGRQLRFCRNFYGMRWDDAVPSLLSYAVNGISKALVREGVSLFRCRS
jgi:teichuronic acid biosynthesis glycosyltransferase TuaG